MYVCGAGCSLAQPAEASLVVLGGLEHWSLGRICVVGDAISLGLAEQNGGHIDGLGERRGGGGDSREQSQNSGPRRID